MIGTFAPKFEVWDLFELPRRRLCIIAAPPPRLPAPVPDGNLRLPDAESSTNYNHLPANFFYKEGAMSHVRYMDRPVRLEGERLQGSPTVKIILGIILSLLILSPAILGLYWELLLPR